MYTSGPSEVIQLLSAPAVSMICSVQPASAENRAQSRWGK
jgi:hypothetical protein